MVADNDMQILTFLGSDTPISKLLNEEIPAVTQAKKDLEQLVKRHQQAQNSLERENKKLERMQNSINSKDPDREDNVLDQDLLNQQVEKRDKLAYDVDMLSKDVTQDQDKITSTLLTLVRFKLEDLSHFMFKFSNVYAIKFTSCFVKLRNVL